MDTTKKNQIVQKSDFFGNFIDGISTNNSDVVVSDWNSFTDNGILFRLDSNLKVTKNTKVSINGFADFAIAAQDSCLVAPDLLSGKVIIQALP